MNIVSRVQFCVIENSDDSDYRWTYTNSDGDKLKLYRDGIELYIDNKKIQLNMNKIDTIRFEHGWKKSESPAIIIKEGDVNHRFIINTSQGKYSDLPILTRVLQRRLHCVKASS